MMRIDGELQVSLDAQTEPWGVKVHRVEIRDVGLPEQMQRAMAKQAEAERERRAKIIAAEGELQASVKLGEAATVMQKKLPVRQTLHHPIGRRRHAEFFAGWDDPGLPSAGVAIELDGRRLCLCRGGRRHEAGQQ